MHSESCPQYQRIALDVASKIASGEIKEDEKIKGRSILSSKYNVSPETVRKALRLLADMKVVEIKEKSGVIILSADNAKRYISLYRNRNELKELGLKFQELMELHSSIEKQMSEVCEKILTAQYHPLPQEKALPNYEVRVSENSDKIGLNIGSLHFWQATGATIIAIRRGDNTIISPGPYAELYGGDVIVFVGLPAAASAVEKFINENQGGEKKL